MSAPIHEATILVPLAEGFEEIEAVTIIDVLRRADLEVVVAGLPGGPVTGSHGITIRPDVFIEDVDPEHYGMIVLPGGMPGASNLRDDERVQNLVAGIRDRSGITAAICAAPKVLLNAGLLDGHKATAYPGVIDGQMTVGAKLLSDAVVTDGRVVTSRGPGTAMDFALTLIEQLLGPEQRRAVEEPLMRP